MPMRIYDRYDVLMELVRKMPSPVSETSSVAVCAAIWSDNTPPSPAPTPANAAAAAPTNTTTSVSLSRSTGRPTNEATFAKSVAEAAAKAHAAVAASTINQESRLSAGGKCPFKPSGHKHYEPYKPYLSNNAPRNPQNSAQKQPTSVTALDLSQTKTPAHIPTPPATATLFTPRAPAAGSKLTATKESTTGLLNNKDYDPTNIDFIGRASEQYRSSPFTFGVVGNGSKDVAAVDTNKVASSSKDRVPTKPYYFGNPSEQPHQSPFAFLGAGAQESRAAARDVDKGLSSNKDRYSSEPHVFGYVSQQPRSAGPSPSVAAERGLDGDVYELIRSVSEGGK